MEHLASNQRVGSSSLSGRAIYSCNFLPTNFTSNFSLAANSVLATSRTRRRTTSPVWFFLLELLFELGKLLPQVRDFFLKIGGVIAEGSDFFLVECYIVPLVRVRVR